MAYIRSANQSNFPPLSAPGLPNYAHSADSRKGYLPLAFQVTSPYDETKALLPHALVSHVNPASISESFNKKIERIQTRGGFVEQHWGDDLTDISVDQSTGAFINLYTGLSSVLRQRTIAWDRYRDLYDLYRNNGSVYDPFGNIVLQGWVMLMYDRGTYLGTFRTFSVEETEEAPFVFKLSWTFKVEKTIQKLPQSTLLSPITRSTGQLRTSRGPDADSLSGGLTQQQLAAYTREEQEVIVTQAIEANQKLSDTAAALDDLDSVNVLITS